MSLIPAELRGPDVRQIRPEQTTSQRMIDLYRRALFVPGQPEQVIPATPQRVIPATNPTSWSDLTLAQRQSIIANPGGNFGSLGIEHVFSLRAAGDAAFNKNYVFDVQQGGVFSSEQKTRAFMVHGATTLIGNSKESYAVWAIPLENTPEQVIPAVPETIIPAVPEGIAEGEVLTLAMVVPATPQIVMPPTPGAPWRLDTQYNEGDIIDIDFSPGSYLQYSMRTNDPTASLIAETPDGQELFRSGRSIQGTSIGWHWLKIGVQDFISYGGGEGVRFGTYGFGGWGWRFGGRARPGTDDLQLKRFVPPQIVFRTQGTFIQKYFHYFRASPQPPTPGRIIPPSVPDRPVPGEPVTVQAGGISVVHRQIAALGATRLRLQGGRLYGVPVQARAASAPEAIAGLRWILGGLPWWGGAWESALAGQWVRRAAWQDLARAVRYAAGLGTTRAVAVRESGNRVTTSDFGAEEFLAADWELLDGTQEPSEIDVTDWVFSGSGGVPFAVVRSTSGGGGDPPVSINPPGGGGGGGGGGTLPGVPSTGEGFVYMRDGQARLVGAELLSTGATWRPS